MSDTVIRVENLGKKYIIGHQKSERYTTLRDSMVNGMKSLGRHLLNPIGQETSSPTREEFWALRDVSFDVKQGDRIGIIGRNGAGKSTLLKILSRITDPTIGRITLQGRVASLLEVGTGFHPELTGRENIFLNGAILGMSKAEINRKFDEIVAFSEVEKFLDTPVKRYSSGMYVRLAFAVAAHLEPEILVVDEVLAVGDIQFQKKCLGKMEDIGKEGRTVLFVSHNMAAIEALCSRCILLDSGNIKNAGCVNTVLSQYKLNAIYRSKENEKKKIVAFSETNQIGISNLTYKILQNELDGRSDLQIEFRVISKKINLNIGIGLEISTMLGIRVTLLAPSITNYIIDRVSGSVRCIFECRDICKYLASGEYLISIWLSKPKVEYLLYAEDILLINIPPVDIFETGTYFESRYHGLVPLPMQYRVETSNTNFFNL